MGGEVELNREEIERVLGKLKEGKTVGVDGIPNEVWRLEREEIREWIWEVCNKVWRGEGGQRTGRRG